MPTPDAGRQRWGRPSLTAALRELAGQSVEYATHRRGVSENVTLTYRRRGDVASGEWWSLAWINAGGAQHCVTGQDLNVLLRRAAEALDADDAEGETDDAQAR